MNRTLSLSRKGAFLLPTRPKPSPLPSNLSRPSQSQNQLTVAQALFPQLRNNGLRLGGYRFYSPAKKGDGPGDNADVNDHPGGKGPNPGPNPKAIYDSNREDQNSTAGAASELKGLTGDFAKIISGSSPQAQGLGAREVSAQGSSHGSMTDDFLSVTKGLFTAVPKPILYTGLAGTIPYVGTSLSIVALAREASLAAAAGGESPAGLDLPTILSYLHTMEHIQITYGAIILSFLGALHWGMEFAKLGGAQGYQRLIIGILPVLAAWPTLLASHGVALAAQWFGFTGMWFLDQRATIAGWTTHWYSTYRFYLSIIVGFSIIGTLVGTSIYGAGAGAITDAHSPHLRHTTERTSALKRLDKVKEKNYPSKGSPAKVDRVEGKVGGPIQVEELDSGEGFLKLRNIEKEEQEKKEQEEKEQKEKEEKEQKKKEQDEKENEQKEKSPNDMKSGTKDRQSGESEKDLGKKKAEDQGATQRSGGEKEQDKEGDDNAEEKKDEGEENKDEGKDEGKDEKKDEGKAEKKDDNKDEKKEESKEEKKDEGEESKSKDNQGGDNKDAQQEQAAKEKGAAGDKNTGMR